MIDLFIARQAIFDSSLKLHGYELLYRAKDTDSAQFDDANQATSQVISTGLINIGLNDLVGNHTAYINLSRDFILGTPELPFPTDKVVLEIASDQQIDDGLSNSLKKLRSANYQIALDGLSPDAPTLALLPMASIAKIDLSKTEQSQLPALINQINQHSVQLIAEKVEDGAQVDQLLALGFDYLQGFFFSKPANLKHSSLSTNQQAMMNLLAIVYKDETSIEAIETAISQDLTLSYHLLKYINSAFFNLSNPVDSIRQAVVYLGRDTLKTWATVISMADYSDKPDELLSLALVRAKLCESFAKAINSNDKDSFFTVGLLSVLDALMDQPMKNIVSKLPLNHALIAALVDHHGQMGEALRCCLALEQGAWNDIAFDDLSAAAVNIQYRTALQWADDAVQNMNL